MSTLAKHILFPDGSSKATTLVDPVAFTLALVGAPLIVGILGAPLLLIPSFAVIFGGPLYLIFGGPILWAAIRRGMMGHGHFSGLAAKTMLLLLVPMSALILFDLNRMSDLSPAIWSILILGTISVAMAALWGEVFGRLYAKLRSKNFPA